MDKSVYSFMHRDDADEIQRMIEMVMNGGANGSSVEFRLLMASGEFAPMACLVANMMEVPSVNGLVITVRPYRREEAKGP